MHYLMTMKHLSVTCHYSSTSKHGVSVHIGRSHVRRTLNISEAISEELLNHSYVKETRSETEHVHNSTVKATENEELYRT